jgi:type VI secretion system protein ImpE
VATPQQLLREGNLSAAVEAARNQVRSAPADSRHRVLLFQLQCVQGLWDKALTQLDVIRDLDAEALPMVQTYREAIRCEVLRESVFAGDRSPFVFGEPQQWIAWLLEALKLLAKGHVAESQQLRDQAFEQAPATTGSIDGTPFEWIADADPRFGPCLEAIVNGRYYWIPFHRVKSVRIEKPADLRDTVWMPANFTWANGGETVGLIPTRYPGSQAAADPLVQLARVTEWDARTEELSVGIGQRLFGTDAGEYALMDTRKIDLDVAAEAAAPASAP